MNFQFWNERFAANKHTYGLEPNLLFKQFIDNLPPGKLLLPGEGEGRNAVYAALNGWEVTAFDYSDIAKKHALELAEKNNVTINYELASIEDFEVESTEKFDLIAFLYLHLPPEIRMKQYQRISEFLSDSGKIFSVGFSKDQMQNDSGGPKNADMLFSKKELIEDFESFKNIEVKEFEYSLNEGSFHKGKANLIVLIASNQF